MKIKKVIKLINDERVVLKRASAKACDATSTDICHEIDNAYCIVNSYDVCTKDFAACSYDSEDYCTYIDTDPCSVGSKDYKYN